MSNENKKQDKIDNMTTDIFTKLEKKSKEDDKKIKHQDDLIRKLTSKIKKQEENYIILQRTTENLFNQTIITEDKEKGTTAEDVVNRLFKKKKK